MVQADIHARRGEAAAALEALTQGKAGFAQLGIEEGFDREFEGRVLRLLGRLDGALAALEEGLGLAANFPVEAAWLWNELVLTHQARGDRDAALAAARHAIDTFEALGAPRMVDAVRALAGMPPHVPWPAGAKPLP